MGTFKWPVRLETLDGRRSVEVDAAVDTGAFYTVVPAAQLRELGVEPEGMRSFELADGRRVDNPIGQVRATIDGDSVITLVVFGADGGPVLLGAYTLEGLALAVDPVNERLAPAELTL